MKKFFKSTIALLVLVIISCETFPTENEVTKIGDKEVWIEESKFKPFHKYVNLGQEVVWINKDSLNHTVTSGLPGERSGNEFDSGVLLPGDTFTVNFSREEQAYRYHCEIHGVDANNPPVVRIRDTYQK